MSKGTELRPTGNEYKTVWVGREAREYCIAGHRQLGWILIEIVPPPCGGRVGALVFTRADVSYQDPDMVRLGKRLDAYVKQVNALERMKKKAPFRVSFMMGCAGACFIGLGMRALLFGLIFVALLFFCLGISHIALAQISGQRFTVEKADYTDRIIRQRQAEMEEVIRKMQWIHKNRLQSEDEKW